MKAWIRMTIVAAALAAGFPLTMPATAGSNTQFDGVGSLPGAGECDDISAYFAMKFEGDLVGCLYTIAFETVQQTPSGIYQERGTERFVGCLADGSACGTFDTAYKITVKFAEDGSEVHGRCQHPITDGTGDFAGATGRFDMKDDVVNVLFYYRGHLKLADSHESTVLTSGSTDAGTSGGC